MATRRNTTRKAATVDVNVDDVVNHDTGETTDEATPTSNRKYMSHANCTHARQGEAGKIARAKCRRDIRAWLAAEAEFLANENVEVAV